MTHKKYTAALCYNIKQLRLTNQLSKRKMARLLGISTRSLTMIERGEIPPRLTCKILFQVCGTFYITPDRLFVPPCEEITQE